MSISDGGKPTVLIVEDELLIRWAIAEHLQDCGFKIVTASNAEEAISAIERYRSTIHVVFSDVRMPGRIDGFGLANWIAKHRPDVAVVLTSGHADNQQAAEQPCEKQPEIVRKPYDFRDVAERLRKAIRADS
jgi:DNA-binding NtrC family response regulator